MTNVKQEEIVAGLAQELRRGVVVLAVLSQLDEPQYGYSLVSKLADRGFPLRRNAVPLISQTREAGPSRACGIQTNRDPVSTTNLASWGRDLH